jgi:hypothetical protein
MLFWLFCKARKTNKDGDELFVYDDPWRIHQRRKSWSDVPCIGKLVSCCKVSDKQKGDDGKERRKKSVHASKLSQKEKDAKIK